VLASNFGADLLPLPVAKATDDTESAIAQMIVLIDVFMAVFFND
jgi:hypothetical protein